MNEPIKAGDLVAVVRWPCSCAQELGYTFHVASLINYPTGHCSWCGHEHAGGAKAMDSHGYSYPIYVLKRIPPLEKLEGQPTQEDIREPA